MNKPPKFLVSKSRDGRTFIHHTQNPSFLAEVVEMMPDVEYLAQVEVRGAHYGFVEVERYEEEMKPGKLTRTLMRLPNWYKSYVLRNETI